MATKILNKANLLTFNILTEIGRHSVDTTWNTTKATLSLYFKRANNVDQNKKCM